MSTSHIESHLVKLDNVLEAPKPMTALEEGLAFETPEEATEGIFRPSELMCKMKQRLHSRFEPGVKATTVDGLSKAEMVKLTGCSSITDWAKKPGFMNWFLNPVYEDEKLEFLYYLSYNALEDILLNDDPKAAGSKLAAVKLILEMKGRIGSKSLTSEASGDKTDKAVKSMSNEDLLKIVNVSKAK